MGSKDVENDRPKRTKKGICWRVLVAITFLAMLAVIIGLVVLVVRKDDKQNKTTRGPIHPAPTEPPQPEVTPSATGAYRYGAVAADAKVCSEIGNFILASKGGSSADAAIASLLCLGVVQAHSTGIGGGFFMTVYDRNSGNVETMISREVAPLNATETMFKDGAASSTEGGMAIGVPGEISGLAAVHKKYGKLPWESLFEPAIRLCEEGLEVTSDLAGAIDYILDNKNPPSTLRSVLLKPDGVPFVEGDIMKRPLLAQTLRTIAAEGANSFYNGTLAGLIVQEVQNNGGIIQQEDLTGYRPVWKEPVSITLDNGDYTMYGPPAPSSAGVMQYMLNILDGYDISPADIDSEGKEILLYHRLVEALKFGYGKRSHLGDEDYVNVTDWKALLQDSSYADLTRAKVNDSTVLPFKDYEPAFEIVNDGGTTHLSVFGVDGLFISTTSTINTYFGSLVMGNMTGIIYNNEMDDFSTPGTINFFGVPASASNFIVPGKRPMSSMSPTIITDNQGVVRMIAGASGGTRIISGTLEVIMNSLWLDMDMEEALDRGRLHHQLLPNVINYEELSQSHIDALKKKGHDLQKFPRKCCYVQAIRNKCTMSTSGMRNYTDYCIQAGSDRRKGGAPDGY